MSNSGTVGRLQAALAAATNDVTIAAANLNFDFSLVKVEAPAEYQPLGKVLAPSRLNEAELGPIHHTAQRLGALFEGVCAPSPNLIKAYGIRASEISRKSAENEEATNKNWIFSEYGGFDGRSIWAAATSRKSALPIHLLACILARMWSSAEATSIWVEIVEERRREIAQLFIQDEPVPFQISAAAAQAEISRDQLAKWDASARAWLRTADAIKCREYKQFQLIIQNVDLDNTQETFLYNSVMNVWKSAIMAMEGLVSGSPYVVKDGAILFGLSAWHLFTDMLVFSGKSCNKKVEMRDELVKSGGFLSLGVSDNGRNKEGAYWSLSLAHHKYYGSSVERTRHLDTDGSRLSFSELVLAALGTMLARWKVPAKGMELALRVLLEIGQTAPAGTNYRIEELWPSIMVGPLKRFFDNAESAALAISLGRRRPMFLPQFQDSHRPFFGFLQLKLMLSVMAGVDSQIELLRRLAQRLEGLDGTSTIIVYEETVSGLHGLHFATAFPTRGAHEATRNKHRRWVDVPEVYRDIPEEIVEYADEDPSKVLKFHGAKVWEGGKPKYAFLFGNEDETGVYVDTLLGFDYLARAGDVGNDILTYEDLLWCFQSGLISAPKLRQKLQATEDAFATFLKVMVAISQVYDIPSLGGATISSSILDDDFSPPIFKKGFDGTAWSKSRWWQISDAVELSRKNTVRLMAYFETGTNVGEMVQDNYNFIGLSSGDSIFILTGLLEDPSQSYPECHFTRLLGNTGSAGVALLTLPTDLRVRKVDPKAWRIATNPFDGSLSDCFEKTSMHLSFTDWKIPVYQSHTVGNRASDAYIVEAYISIRESGNWIADTDVFRARQMAEHLDMSRHHKKSDCTAWESSQPTTQSGLASVETWDQIIDCPEGSFVTHSHGNWLARLAIISVLHQTGFDRRRTICVCPEDTCWRCLKVPSHVDIIFIG